MTGFELKLWRNGMGWEQERAAEELGVSRRTYQGYEKTSPPKAVVLATQALSFRAIWPEATDNLRKLAALVGH
jgi:DNA-binding XRE family transcriptional regulator